MGAFRCCRTPVMLSRKTRFAAVGTVCVVSGLAWFFRPADPETGGGAGEDRAWPGVSRIQGAAEPVLAMRMAAGEELAVSMEEVCVRQADGSDVFVKLDPPATPGTYRERIAAFSAEGEALPVAYPDGVERNEVNRRLVTRKLRVRVAGERADEVAGRNHLDVAERPDHAPGWVVLEAADPLKALAAVNGVRNSAGVEEADVVMGRKRYAKAMPDDAAIYDLWHLKNATVSPSITHANVEGAWAYPTAGAGVRGRGIRIGIVDDGLQTAHPDLSGNVDVANGWDWTSGDSDPNPAVNGSPPYSYGDYHGTSVAGVAGAVGNNGAGVCGVAPESKLVGMRLTGGGANPDDTKESGAFGWKNDLIQVKNNSWGPADWPYNLEAPEPMAKTALETAIATGRGGKGTIFVWAGGNGKTTGDNSNYDGYANSIYTIAVGASNGSGVSSSFSEPGANLLVVGPSGTSGGPLISTTDRTGSLGRVSGDYNTIFTGTSSATPVVSGVVALMLEKNPNLGWRDVQEILARSATKVSPSDAGWRTNGAGLSFNHQFGAGLVNATVAVNLANGWTNLPAHASLASTNSGSVVIPENNAAGVAKTFTFTQTSHRVEHVTVKANISHSFRGNLRITLTSPSGMESVLADTFNSSNPAANYNWTFSSVHHWGESAYGTWIVKVADLSGSVNTTGGTLEDVTLTLYGGAHAFPNHPPSVTAASLGVPGQAFEDETVLVSSTTASDPEGSPVTLAYQWQWSTDGQVYTNATGDTASQLVMAANRAGKLWRCRITPSDGTDAGNPFVTAAVNLLSRPGKLAKNGEPYSFACGLVLPYTSAVPLFRIAMGSNVPDGLTLNASTGVLSGTVSAGAVRGDHAITIERYDTGGAFVSQSFVIKVYPANYGQWIGGFSVAAADGAIDDDGDGLPNLIEYMMDLDPAHRDEDGVVFSDEGNELSLTFRESKIPTDVALEAEWSTGLLPGAIWQDSGLIRTVLEEDDFSRLVRVSLGISAVDEKRFLRLKAETVDP